MFILFWIDNGFFGGNNIVRVFVYIPVIAYPVAKLLKIPYKKICSVLAFGPLAVHAVSHFGCMFVGCCMGYPCSWGLYNVAYEDIRFPIQPIEAIAAWAIIIFLLVRAKKRNYIPDGLEYPLMLILFGSTRFIFEFFRDNDRFRWGCSGLAFHALFMFIVGVVALIILKKREKKQAEQSASEITPV
jgi:phosphatidylglycerol:prolipoprotein diacylglycerol transferase